jgi:hypothetical protein
MTYHQLQQMKYRHLCKMLKLLATVRPHISIKDMPYQIRARIREMDNEIKKVNHYSAEIAKKI